MSAGLDADRLPETSAARLRWLAGQSWSGRFYLAGGAALALHLGHRRPRGLDLMSPSAPLLSAERRAVMQEIVPLVPDVSVETARDGYLDLLFPDNVPVRLFHYPYPTLEPTIPAGRDSAARIMVASAIDLALMKLGAIISRGGRRDFVDLFLLRSCVSLEAALGRSSQKFPLVRDFPLQALKGLADRSIARGEPMPRLLLEVSWDEIERWIDTEVRGLARVEIGLRDEPDDTSTSRSQIGT